MDRDLFFPPMGPIRGASFDTARSDASTLPFSRMSFDIENPPPRGAEDHGRSRSAPQPRPRKKGWCWDWQYRCDQSLTLRTTFRWLPFLAIAISATAAFFGIKNYLFLEASRATSILRQLQPILIRAHEEILAKLSEILAKTNATGTCGPGPGPGPGPGRAPL